MRPKKLVHPENLGMCVTRSALGGVIWKPDSLLVVSLGEDVATKQAILLLPTAVSLLPLTALCQFPSVWERETCHLCWPQTLLPGVG